MCPINFQRHRGGIPIQEVRGQGSEGYKSAVGLGQNMNENIDSLPPQIKDVWKIFLYIFCEYGH